MTDIDITATGSLADALRGHPSATGLAVQIDGRPALRASYALVSGNVVLNFRTTEAAPDPEASAAALTAELVTSAPEVKVAKNRK